MQSTLARLRHMFLALDHHLHHLTNLLEATQDNLIPFNEAIAVILHARLLAKLADELLSAAQIVAGHTRKQVVDGLELESAMHPVQPRRTIDVHGRPHLALGKALAGPEVARRHTPVGKCDLNVQRHGDEVGDEDESDADGPGGEVCPDEEVAEEIPVAAHEGDFDGARPPGCAELGRAGGHEVQPAEDVEVEARERHDGVVHVFLVGDQQVAGAVPDELPVVEGGEDRFKVGWGGGEERDVLDVGVVLRHVGHQVVHVVRGFPPADAQAAAEVGDEGPD